MVYMAHTDLPANFIKTVTEHNVKIENIEKVTHDTNLKVDKLVDEIRALHINFASSKNIETRVGDLEVTTTELVASKNRVVGALTVGTVAGTIISVIGTWVVELFKFKN